jgi:hypothetical protein
MGYGSGGVNVQSPAVVARAAALGDLLAGDELRQEAAHEGVARAVGVHQLLLREGDHGEAVQLALLGVAVQVAAFERHILNPVFHLIDARVETNWVPGPFQVWVRGSQRVRGPHLGHDCVLHALGEDDGARAVAGRLGHLGDLHRDLSHVRGVAAQLDPFESKGLKPGFQAKFETGFSLHGFEG